MEAIIEIEGVDMAIVRLTRQEASRGDLPEVCIVCGERADEFRSKTMYWHPPWVFLLILLFVWPFIIAALLTQQRMRVQLPFCSQHRGHWSVRAWTTCLTFAGIFILGFVFFAVFIAAQERGRGRGNDAAMGVVCMIWLVLLLGWIVLVAILSFTAVRPQEIKESAIILKGIHPHFIDALEEHDKVAGREEEDYRRERRRRREREREELAEDFDADPRHRARPEDQGRYRAERPRKPRPRDEYEDQE